MIASAVNRLGHDQLWWTGPWEYAAAYTRGPSNSGWQRRILPLTVELLVPGWIREDVDEILHH